MRGFHIRASPRFTSRLYVKMGRSSSSHEVSELLVRWQGGDPGALESLIPLVYTELRKLARSYLRRERPNHTLQSAALVHEAYVRLAGNTAPDWKNRTQFFGVAAWLMREILVEHARSRAAAKRGGGISPISLNEILNIPQERSVDFILLDDALRRLSELDERQCRIVELRFFAGLSIEDTSEALGISAATVSREWTTARLWLRHELARTAKA
jgi:RNA polymerase sigma factor (TIGR02999 family)